MRLFIGIELPQEIKQALVRVQQELKKLNLFSGSYVASENLHITMLFLGSVSQEEYPPLVEVLNRVTGTPFNLTLGSLGVPSWSDPRVLWVDTPSDKLTALYKSLCTEIDISEKRSFSGHCTLARIKKVPDKTALKTALTQIPVEPLSWQVTKFVLIDSQTLPSGAVYTVLDHVELKK